jgi:invasion protein IalB
LPSKPHISSDRNQGKTRQNVLRRISVVPCGFLPQLQAICACCVPACQPGTGGLNAGAIVFRTGNNVRISRSVSVLAISGLVALATVGLSGMSRAQDTTDGKSDAEAPPGAAFGPRAGQPKVNQPKVTTEKIATHGSWAVECSEVQIPEGQPKPPVTKSCGMVQTSKNEKIDSLAITVIVNQVKSGEKTVTVMRVLAPIGVFLPTGIPVEIDGAALPNRLQFTQCAPRVCEAMGEFSEETLTKFKKGDKSTFYIYAKAGSGIPMNVSLDGFGAAVAELAKH